MQIFKSILHIEHLLFQNSVLLCTHFSYQPNLNSPTFKQTKIKAKGRKKEKIGKKNYTSHSYLLTQERCLLLPGIAIPKISENSQDIRKTKVQAHRLHIN